MSLLLTPCRAVSSSSARWSESQDGRDRESLVSSGVCSEDCTCGVGKELSDKQVVLVLGVFLEILPFSGVGFFFSSWGCSHRPLLV